MACPRTNTSRSPRKRPRPINAHCTRTNYSLKCIHLFRYPLINSGAIGFVFFAPFSRSRSNLRNSSLLIFSWSIMSLMPGAYFGVMYQYCSCATFWMLKKRVAASCSIYRKTNYEIRILLKSTTTLDCWGEAEYDLLTRFRSIHLNLHIESLF